MAIEPNVLEILKLVRKTSSVKDDEPKPSDDSNAIALGFDLMEDMYTDATEVPEQTRLD